ncbi:glycosyltransferase family 2 protein [Paracoccus zhejiangensis]|uniref:Glycosyltransferase n=1 Tax=Paracoccus zhejiangensis TaxID=1077935 RepID=A0A2H5F4Z1_9RHOB|nr:glycosyltransferase family 2 protein [Paracoccus zhejiangensis]AUH66605.1 glycosyltransferase [Paracoccus zhejiangensis]
MTTKIDILMCTFRRPAVAEAIATLAPLRLPPDSDVRLVIADNDDTDSARQVVAEAAGALPYPCQYIHAPARNISIARNACLDAASDRGADWIAGLDDDEAVHPDWLVEIMAVARQADGAFGKVLAQYPEDAPDWLSRLDFHSTHPERTPQPIRTGNSGNVALRWQGTPWQDERYDLSRGQSGGEDTEFFLRLTGMGARMLPAPRAILTEPVPPARQTLDWLGLRRHRMGQTHIVTAETPTERTRLFVTASAKATYCRLREKLAGDETGRIFWYLRGQLHRGVIAGLRDVTPPQLYGKDPV